MTSTLSMGLNKSDQYIKENAIDIHTRILDFKSNEKVYLTKEIQIPQLEVPVKRYIRCESFGYYEDYRICHDNLIISI